MMAYSILVGLEWVGILLMIFMIGFLIQQKPSMQQQYLLILFFSLFINVVGYLFELTAEGPAEALRAVQFLYCGKPFIILSMVLFVLEYCHVVIPKKIKICMFLVQLCITMLVLTCEHHKLYYKGMIFTNKGLFPHLQFEHGPLYIFNNIQITFYLAMLIVACILKIKRSRNSVEKKQAIKFIIILVIMGSCFISFLAGITQGYDLTILGYIISALILANVLIKDHLLEAIDLAKTLAVDDFTDSVVVLNNEKEIIYQNNKAEEMFKLSLGEIDEKLWSVFDWAHNNSTEIKLEDCYFNVKKQDLILHEEEIGTLYVLDDITDQYMYTKNIQEQAKVMEELKDEAERANKAKSNFLASMSHEIRTPINTVLGLDTMILRESKEDNTRKNALNIYSAGQSLLSIINDVLDVSKIESGKMEIIPVDYDVASLINDVSNMIRPKANDKKLEFIVKLDPSVPSRLMGDDVRIKQVLINLLTNAVKYTHEGSVTLSVGGEFDGDNFKMYLSVSDTGIGIKPEDIDGLFSEFVRIEEERNRNIEGTGLGINIVVRLLELMGSHIEVDSVYGEGSDFHFSLCQVITNREPIGNLEERIFNQSKEYKYSAKYIIPEVRLLVVDDNPMNLLVFTELLKGLKCDIDEAESGFECLELVTKKKYDIIFMDHMMPKMDGVETLAKMREFGDYINANTPVIALTANAIAGAKESYMEAGFTDYLAKPINPEKLEEMIADIIPDEMKKPAEDEETDSTGKKADNGVSDNNNDSEIELPTVEGIDWDYAILKLGSAKLVTDVVKDVYHVAPNDIKTISSMYEDIVAAAEGEAKEEAYKSFRIKVHSIKSTTAMVGALNVSALAKTLEYAARDLDRSTIDAVFGILIRDYAKLRDAIGEGFGFASELEEAKPLIDKAVLEDYIDSLKDAMEFLDVDTADNIMNELQNYSFEEDVAEIIEEIGVGVRNLDTDSVLESIDKLGTGQNCK